MNGPFLGLILTIVLLITGSLVFVNLVSEKCEREGGVYANNSCLSRQDLDRLNGRDQK